MASAVCPFGRGQSPRVRSCGMGTCLRTSGEGGAWVGNMSIGMLLAWAGGCRMGVVAELCYWHGVGVWWSWLWVVVGGRRQTELESALERLVVGLHAHGNALRAERARGW